MTDSKDTDKKKKPAPFGRSTWLYVGSIVILIIVVVTFIGAPVATSAVGSGRLVFGRYDKEDILYQPGNFFARQYEVVAQSLRDSGNATNLELQLRLAWREAFNRTVLHKAVLNAAEEAGIRVSEQRVDELIAQDPRFQFNGRFDTEAYRSISSQERFALRNFHKENAVFETVVRDAITASRFSTAEKEFVGSMTGPQRSFDVVRFAFTDFPESQVSAFLADNPDLFTQLDLAVVTLADEEEAQEIRAQALQPGNPFGGLARTYSRDLYADQDGQIGEIYGYELQQELTSPSDLAVILALSEGDISEPVETTSGWSFYQAISSPNAPTQTAEIIAEARNYMQVFEQGRIQDFVREEALAFAATAGELGFAETAEAADRAVLSTGFFPINYGNIQFLDRVQSRDIPELADAAFRENFFTTAFSLEADAISEPVVLRQSVLLMRLREEIPAQQDDVEFIVDFYDAIARQFYSNEIENAFVDDELLQDNFAQAFNRYVLGN